MAQTLQAALVSSCLCLTVSCEALSGMGVVGRCLEFPPRPSPSGCSAPQPYLPLPHPRGSPPGKVRSGETRRPAPSSRLERKGGEQAG